MADFSLFAYQAGLRRRSSEFKSSPQCHVQKSKKAVTKGRGVKTMNPFSQGARIVGRSKQDGLYYPGEEGVGRGIEERERERGEGQEDRQREKRDRQTERMRER